MDHHRSKWETVYQISDHRRLFWMQPIGSRQIRVRDKQAAQQTGSQICVKVIFHRFPKCEAILDAERRALFRLKSIHAMESTSMLGR